MKARVKATGEIMEIENYDIDKLYSYDENEVEIILERAPDYWTRLEHQAAIGAMQGILSCPEWNIVPREGVSHAQECALQAQEFAHALVEKLKEKEERK